MTKKSRLYFLVIALFITAIILFTSGFLIFLQSHAPVGAALTESSASHTAAINNAISWGDATTLGLVAAILLLFVYYVAKS